MKIVIPSMARADIQFTVNQLKMGGIPDRYKCYLVIPKEEYNKYMVFLKLGFHIIPTIAEGINNVRQFVMEYCKNKDDKILMMDDDLRFFTRPEFYDVALFQSTGEEILLMIQWLEKQLDDYAHASISARTQNFQLTSRMERAEGFELKVVRPYRIYGYRQDIVLGEGLDFHAGLQVNTMDDFHMTLNLLELGYRNIVSCRWAHDQCTSNSRGGAASYRDLEMLKMCALNLKEKHPQVVKTRLATTRSSWGGTPENPVTRTDVTIQWQKALGIRAGESKL